MTGDPGSQPQQPARGRRTHPGPRPAPHARLPRPVRIVIDVAAVSVIALGSITLSLLITPMQAVTAAGQEIRVGVAAPSWSLSGPGELDLFGQQIPTTIQFLGLVRPRLELSRITLTEQLNQFAGAGAAAAAQSLEHALVGGWERFFAWQIAVCGLTALILFGALAGWLRQGSRRTAGMIVIGVLVTEVLNLGGVMITAYTAPAKLAGITSLQQLVGGAPPPAVTGKTAGGHVQIRNVVVVGDSTAAGAGNRPLIDGTAEDKACERSQDAYAVDLALANGWKVTNLACTGATIASGLLGPQQVGDRTVPAQLQQPAVAKADLVIISIGANDVHWTDLLELCAISQDCSNSAEQAFFQQQLAGLSRDLLQLVSQLQLLPNHPVVVVNAYYDPFADDIGCLTSHGMTKAKHRSLEADRNALNEILAKSATAAGFHTAVPDFTDHGLCSALPYVQGLTAAAPFHPTASGELAIALADEQALGQPPR